MKASIQRLVLGAIDTNCYLVTDQETGKGVLIDPALYNDELEQVLQQLGEGNLSYIFLTHRHYDHLLGVYDVKQRTGAQIVIPELEAAALTDDTVSRARPGTQQYVEPDILVTEGSEITLGGLTFRFLITPGHTVGGCCIVMEDVMFSGDTLFEGTVGRTDLPSGSYLQIMQSVARLAALEGDYRVLPGHGEETTLSRERKYNPYMKDANYASLS